MGGGFGISLFEQAVGFHAGSLSVPFGLLHGLALLTGGVQGRGSGEGCCGNLGDTHGGLLFAGCVYLRYDSSKEGKDTLFTDPGINLAGIQKGVRETVREENFEVCQKLAHG